LGQKASQRTEREICLEQEIVDLLAAIKREERKLEKELTKLQSKLSGVRAAAKALGDTTIPSVLAKLRNKR